MLKSVRVLALCLALGFGSLAPFAEQAAFGRLTFTKDVLPIMQENCQICHRPGGDNISGMVAPMSLVTYREVRPWAKAIARAVEVRDMPPWDATHLTDGQFSNERTLSEQEIETLVRWVETGAARGNPDDVPEKVSFENRDGWYMGAPDLVLQIKRTWVGDEVIDWQPRFSLAITEDQLPEPRWIQAVEMRPGSEVVHHMIAAAQAPAIEGHPKEFFMAGSIAAGEEPTMYPDGFGNLLRAGTVLAGSMHYHKEPGPGTGVWDESVIGFKFHPKDVQIKYKVTRGGIGAGSFEIPPRVPYWEVGSSMTFEDDTLLISLHPHMHYRGTSMKYTAYYPDGSTEVLLDVDRYDYAWQTQYIYRQPKYLPPGTRIDVRATYDNSEAVRAQTPQLNIDRAIRFGAASTDEMMIPFAEWSQIDREDVPRYRDLEGSEED